MGPALAGWAGYADSEGYNEDTERTAWRYRDYVVNAFNKDLPWDQFIREQLAGDEMVKRRIPSCSPPDRQAHRHRLSP